ncbi:hypothetical protein BPAE_0036g00030 [Botrytis paeoniae]|uniref:Uncharacterized protein n=1 Tax=Botrytis paeoniae TaxID=278948 RepID=A0A4Z1FXM5_9HELO|nr:hypothetical protein BPAE_0036g00030 [Botrytis paeoniae]
MTSSTKAFLEHGQLLGSRSIELAINLRFAAATPGMITGWLMVVVLVGLEQYQLVAEFTHSTMSGCCEDHYHHFS